MIFVVEPLRRHAANALASADIHLVTIAPDPRRRLNFHLGHNSSSAASVRSLSPGLHPPSPLGAILSLCPPAKPTERRRAGRRLRADRAGRVSGISVTSGGRLRISTPTRRWASIISTSISTRQRHGHREGHPYGRACRARRGKPAALRPDHAAPGRVTRRASGTPGRVTSSATAANMACRCSFGREARPTGSNREPKQRREDDPGLGWARRG